MQLEEQWNETIANLSHGNYTWPKHEYIRSGSNSGRFEPTPTYGLKIWDGGHDDLLVNADFGDGDTIQFFRFVLQARERVRSLTLRCNQDLHPLFQGHDISLVNKDVEIPEATAIIHPMAIPRVLNLDFDGEPYLKESGDPPHPAILNAVKDLQCLKIGVCWAGNPYHPRDAERSIPVDELNDAIVHEGVTLFSLVKHVEPEVGFFDMRGLMGDWGQTSHVLDHMDVVMTVDTAVGHLAGAMGKETILLLPENVDWRWRGKTWYDNHKLYIKKPGESWRDLIDQAMEDLINP